MDKSQIFRRNVCYWSTSIQCSLMVTMTDDQVDYKSSVRNYLSSHTDMSINEEGAELVGDFLNGLQKEILDNLKDNLEAGSSDSLRSAQQTVENVFEGPLQNPVVANCQRRVMLVETGILSTDRVSPSETEKYKKKSTAKTTPLSTEETTPPSTAETTSPSVVDAAKRTIPKSIKKLMERANVKADKEEEALKITMPRSMKKVQKALNINADKGGSTKLNSLMANLLNFMATDVSFNCGIMGNRDVTAMELKKVMDSFITGNLSEKVTSDGCRCLTLYETGLIEFEEEKKCSTNTSPAKTVKKKTANKTVSKKSYELETANSVGTRCLTLHQSANIPPAVMGNKRSCKRPAETTCVITRAAKNKEDIVPPVKKPCSLMKELDAKALELKKHLDDFVTDGRVSESERLLEPLLSAIEGFLPHLLAQKALSNSCPYQ